MSQNNSPHYQWLIVSDLDGTLLDHDDYSHTPVDPLLRRLEQRGVPVILNSSKTSTEMRRLRRELHNGHPFICENGSAIFIPTNYFTARPPRARTDGNYWIVETGVTRARLLDYLHTDARRYGAPYLSFAAASVEEIVAATGLTREQAQAAQDRHYSEPLLWRGSEAEKTAFCQRARAAGLATLQGGRFLHLLGPTDKGSATHTLLDCYRSERPGDYRLIAAGDSDNDLDMLEAADVAVVIRARGRQPPQVTTTTQRRVIVSEQVGPAGWRDVIGSLIPA